MNRTIRWVAAASGGLLLMLAGGLAFFPAQAVDFNRDIRPILNSRCIACHGGVKQSGGLSFLTREEALLPAESGRAAIVPGDPENSELIRRVLHADLEERMPLEHEPLKAEEVALLKRWIEQGALWDLHWAFIAPSPDIEPPRSRWGSSGIDGGSKQAPASVSLWRTWRRRPRCGPSSKPKAVSARLLRSAI